MASADTSLATLLQTEAPLSTKEAAAFAKLIEEVRPFDEAYEHHSSQAVQSRMEIIGRLELYKKQFNQRSEAHQRIEGYYRARGWSSSTVSNNSLAYIQRLMLIEADQEELASKLSMKQLLEIHRSGIGQASLIEHAIKYEKKVGQLPSFRQMQAFRTGKTDLSFNPLRQDAITRNIDRDVEQTGSPYNLDRLKPQAELVLENKHNDESSEVEVTVPSTAAPIDVITVEADAVAIAEATAAEPEVVNEPPPPNYREHLLGLMRSYKCESEVVLRESIPMLRRVLRDIEEMV